MRPALLAGLLALAAAAALAAPIPDDARVHVVATSHLDTQWRWTIRTTIDEYLLRTLDDNFALLERYPDYVFNFEGAFRYQLIREYYPERFERLKEYVAEDRWRVCGSWLDAVDVNMPSPEALFRHALYGNRWFDREFGKRSVDVFLPDCFGFGHALPSIMAHSGLTGFSTQKLTWGSAYGTPFDLGRWRGVDGSEVLAAVNPGAYVGRIESDLSRDEDIQAAIARTTEAGGPPVAYRYYGTGDTGGAPAEESVEWIEKSVASDGPVRVIPAGADQIFRDLSADEAASLPLYDGELVMTGHGAGCYTSQAAMKRWNRRCEVFADAAERAAAMAWHLGAGPYPHAELERAWTRFLWHGFHDDLTGTSIPEAYVFSWNDMLLSQQEFGQILHHATDAVVRGLDTAVEHEPYVVFNPLGFEHTGMVRLADSGSVARVTGPDGRDIAFQMLDDGSIAFTATVPACGFAVFDIAPGPAPQPSREPFAWDAGAGILDTPRYRLRFSADGLASLVDKTTGRELLAAPPRLQLLHDSPANWAAWEIDYDDIVAAPYAEVPLGGEPLSVEVGPVCARLRFRHEAAGSVFRQTLTVAGARLDWDLDIDWTTKATLLKAAFTTTARDTTVTYDLGLGAIERGVNRARLYEVPAQRWADLTDVSGAFGLTVMNDGRHGWDHPDERTLRLSLLRTPAVNENWRWIDDEKSQDLGRHRLTISMMGHGDIWRTDAVRQADRLNQPLLAFRAFAKTPGPWGRAVSLVRVEDPRVAVRAVKKSEDGERLVVRLQEVTGRPVRGATVTTLAPALSVHELRADEVEIPAGADVSLQDGALVCDLKPYQPRTFALELAPPPAGRSVAVTVSAPVDLPWNLDGISTAAAPRDGDLDGDGHTLPGEVLPRAFTRDGVRFRTGPREPGAANMVRCEGQTVSRPDAALPVLDVLMLSLDGPRPARFGFPDGTHHREWIADGTEPFGQWDSRVVGDDTVHEAADLIPAYVAGNDLGWVVTHRHDPDGRDESYVFTNLYRVRVPLPDGCEDVTLPDDPALVIAAMSRTTAPACTPEFSAVDRPCAASLRIDATRRAFVDSVEIRVSSPNLDSAIRWSIEGEPLTGHDGGTITLHETTSLIFEARAAGIPEPSVRHATFTRLEPWPATDGSAEPGLAAASYQGAWDALPAWSGLTPTATSINATVAIPEGLPDEEIGVVLDGFLDAPARGVYRFWLSSDDGSRLHLGGRVLIDHDGLHGSSALWADAPLAAGRHRIRVEFFQNKGGRDLQLEWSGPGIPRQPVPATVLTH